MVSGASLQDKLVTAGVTTVHTLCLFPSAPVVHSENYELDLLATVVQLHCDSQVDSLFLMAALNAL